MEATPGARTARLAAIAFGVLFVATFGAFFLASRLKAEPAVLAGMDRLRYFSPNGDGRRDVEPIAFRLDLDDDAAVDIVDADGARGAAGGRRPAHPPRADRARHLGRS